jgi:hypothetical protein
MASVIDQGAFAVSADPVVTPTNLVPALPTIALLNDWMLCSTACTSATATVTTPALWQSVMDVTGTVGRLVLLAHKVEGDDVAPTVAWSGLTTGLSGSPCWARILNMGPDLAEIGGVLQSDVIGAVSNQAASTTAVAGGASITTTTNNDTLFSLAIRLDDAATNVAVPTNTGVTWQYVVADQFTSGIDALTLVALAQQPVAGTIGAFTGVITGGTSVASAGVMIAIRPRPVPVPSLTYTRSRMRPRSQ